MLYAFINLNICIYVSFEVDPSRVGTESDLPNFKRGVLYNV